VLVAFINLFERLQNQKKVDIFRTVKDIRDVKPNEFDSKVSIESCITVNT